MRERRMNYLFGCVVVCGCAVALAGCGSGSGSRTAVPVAAGYGPMPLAGGETSVDAGDAAEAPPDIEAIMAANAAALLEMDSLSIERRRSGESEKPVAEKPIEEPPREAIAAALVDESEPVAVHEIERAPELTRAEQITKTTLELAALLQEQADRSDSPVSSMAALSALEMIERGVAPDPASMPWLSERERELLSAFRDLFSEAGERLASDPNDLLSVRGVIEGLPGAQRFLDFEEAMTQAEEGLTRLVRELAVASGTSETAVEIDVDDHIHTTASGSQIFLRRTLSAELTGEPNHISSEPKRASHGETLCEQNK